MNPLLALDQLDDRMQQPVGGRRDAHRFASAQDQAVQTIDLTALAARQIMRGRRILAWHRRGNFAHGRIDVARSRQLIR
jgi:hypothetical protein